MGPGAGLHCVAGIDVSAEMFQVVQEALACALPGIDLLVCCGDANSGMPVLRWRLGTWVCDSEGRRGIARLVVLATASHGASQAPVAAISLAAAPAAISSGSLASASMGYASVSCNCCALAQSTSLASTVSPAAVLLCFRAARSSPVWSSWSPSGGGIASGPRHRRCPATSFSQQWALSDWEALAGRSGIAARSTQRCQGVRWRRGGQAGSASFLRTRNSRRHTTSNPITAAARSPWLSQWASKTGRFISPSNTAAPIE